MYIIKEGDGIPEEWLEGELVHIYKIKGGREDCISYRPICLTLIIYIIRPQLIAHRLAKILRKITDRNQYGYRGMLSKMDSVIKSGRYIYISKRNNQLANTSHGP